MAKREGRRLPTAIKKRRGTLNVTRVNVKEPDYENLPAIPFPPDDFNPAMRELWMRICSQLNSVGILFASTIEWIEIYCKAYQRMLDAEKLIKDLGLLVQTEKGNWVKNPATLVHNEAFMQMYRISIQFGFTPVSKARVQADGTGGAKKKDKNSRKKVPLR